MGELDLASRELNVLVVVDAYGALAAGTLTNYIYFVDSNGYSGSAKEGTPQLVTKCNVGQVIRWRVEAISPSDNIEIDSFVGTMISNENCVPKKQTVALTNETYWEGVVQAKSSERGKNINYNLRIKMNGKVMQYDPAIYVNP